MARPLRLEFPGAVYHLTARGNARQDVFLDDADRARFLALLGREIDQQRWRCYAYCLMDNHYHLVIETPEANLSTGMRRLNGVYTQAFNRGHDRVGHLFQGRYQSILVEREPYLMELCRYVVLNPVRAGVTARVGDWRWSSYRATGLGAKPPAWLDAASVLAWFDGDGAAARAGYRRFVREGLSAPSPWEDLRGQIWLGGEAFRETMQRRLQGRSTAGIAAAQRRPARPDRAEVLASVMTAFGIAEAPLLARQDKNAYRAAAFLLRRAANLSLRDVAALFSVSPSRISHIQRDIERDIPDRITGQLLTLYKVKN